MKSKKSICIKFAASTVAVAGIIYLISLHYIWYMIIGAIMLSLFLAFAWKPFMLLILFLSLFFFSFLFPLGELGTVLKPIGVILIILTAISLLLNRFSLKFRITKLDALILVFLLSSFFSLYSFCSTETAFRGFIFVLGNCLFYFVCVTLIDRIEKIKPLFWTICVSGIVSAGVGIFQKVFFETLRITGTVREPNYFALVLLPIFPLFLYQFFGAERLLYKGFYGFSILLLTTAIFFTLSRGGMIALLLTAILIAFRTRKVKEVSVLFVSTIIIIAVFLPPEITRGLHLGELTAPIRMPSIHYRASFICSAMQMFFEHPILGVGTDNFFSQFYKYGAVPPSAGIIRPVVHNTYLEILTGMGLVGFIPYMGIIIIAMLNYEKGRQYFKEKGDKKNRLLVESIQMGLMAILIGFLFLSDQHQKLFWFFIALSSALVRHVQNASSKVI